MSRSLTPSHLILAAVALLIGLALGGLGPRGESRDLRDRIAELEARECRGSSQMGREIAEAFRGRAWGGGERSELQAGSGNRVPPMKRQAEATGAEGETQGASGAELEIGASGPEGDGGEGVGEERLQEVMDAMELRRRQSRQALREQAGLTSDQEAEIDGVVDAMNDELGVLAEEFVGLVESSGGEPDRREGMLFARDTLDLLLDSGDAIWNSLDPDQQAGVDPEVLDPLNFVDGRVVHSLSELDRR